MFHFLKKLCDYIFPERDDHRIVRELNRVDFMKLISPRIENDFTYLLSFKDPFVRAVIHEAKFHHNEKAWSLLGEVIVSYLKHTSPETIIIPIPLSPKRLKERGYNQVEMAVRQGLKSLSDRHLRTDFLYRQKHTAPQTSLPRDERLKNLKDAFAVRNGSSIKDRNLIIIDDVATTGATLKAAEASLRPLHPSSITLLAFAH